MLWIWWEIAREAYARRERAAHGTSLGNRTTTCFAGVQAALRIRALALARRIRSLGGRAILHRVF